MTDLIISTSFKCSPYERGNACRGICRYTYGDCCEKCAGIHLSTHPGAGGGLGEPLEAEKSVFQAAICKLRPL